VREELAELEAAAGRGEGRAAEEMGDLLFAVAGLPRYLHLDGEQALREACTAFRDRFARMEADVRARGRPLTEYTADEMFALWRAAR